MRLPLQLLLALPSLAFSQDLGPLEVRNLRSLSIPFLRISPRPFVLADGRNELAFSLEGANDIRFASQGGKAVKEDYEIDRLVARYRFGIGRGNDVTVGGALLSRNGGVLDPLIQFWHRYVLQIRNNIREGQPYGSCYVDIPGHARYGSAIGIGDLNVSLAHQVNPRLMAIGAFKAPTGSDSKLLGSGGWDAGVGLQWHVPINARWDFHMQTSYVFQNPSKELPEARKGVLQGALTLEYRANSKDTYLGQWQAEPSAIVTGVQGSDTSHRMVSLAFRRTMGTDRFLELYMLEDGDWLNYRVPEFANIAPDLTLGVRWIVRR